MELSEKYTPASFAEEIALMKEARTCRMLLLWLNDRRFLREAFGVRLDRWGECSRWRDGEFIDKATSLVGRLDQIEQHGTMFWIDHKNVVHRSKHVEFCDRFGLEIPFLLWKQKGEPEPQGVKGSFVDFDDMMKNYRSASEKGEVWTYESVPE